jgi:ATP-dependent DNA helicase PIF1
MSFLNSVKRILGIGSVNIGELNRRATLEDEKPKSQESAVNRLDEISVTKEYRSVCALLEAGCPAIFVTGNAGTGKSTLIQYLRMALKKKLVVVAPTGVAALNAGGVTIHSFFHFAPKIHEEEDIKFVYDRRMYQKLELIIIDEVSMVRCDLLDSVDKFLRKNRETNALFGGVQLLLIGDLFQLPPVVPKHEWEVLRAKGYASPYFFSSFSLQQASFIPLELTSVFRQQDPSFIDLLNRIRTGDALNSVAAEVNQICFQENVTPTDITLTCTNNQADQINKEELSRLSSREYSFKGTFEGQFAIEHDRLPSPIDLRLKAGARVMFTKNDDQRRWVNGSLGTVHEIDQGMIRVGLASDPLNMICDVPLAKWETFKYSYDPDQDRIVAVKIGEYRQFPLMLAWAVTIHKSQGKTLDNVLVDLGIGAFASGQVYVALSRCRSIKGIRLARPIRITDFKVDPIIKRFYLALAEMMKQNEDVESVLPE